MIRVVVLPIILGMFFACSAGASESGEQNEGEETFSPDEMIMHHVMDAHEWHLWGHSAIPLPVILYHPDKGLSVFMSNKLEGEDENMPPVYDGYALKEGHIVVVDAEGNINETSTAEIWDLSISKTVAGVLISSLLMLWIFISVARSYKRNPNEAPRGLQSAIEPLIVFVRDDIAKSAIGSNYQRFMPYLLTMFFFIFFNNLFGLIPIFPFGANVTGNISVTLTLALFTFAITTFIGNKNYWRHIFAMPGVPIWVLLILTPVEMMGIFLKPFVLMIRLFANMSAGHIIVLSFLSLIFLFGETNPAAGYGVAVGAILFIIFMTALDLLVSFIQAYVFVLLSAMYFGAATEKHH